MARGSTDRDTVNWVLDPFRFRVTRELKRRIGEVDALLEVNEVALRDFVRRAQRSQDTRAFILSASADVGIRVSTPAFDVATRQMATAYLIIVHESLGSYFSDLRDERQSLVPETTYPPKEKGEDPLTYALRVGTELSGKNLDILLATSLFEVCDYYRLVRNSAAHGGSTAVLPYPDTLTKKLSEIDEMFHLKTRVPSDYASICFEDFILYSRACKKMAVVLNDLYAPTAQQVAAFLQRTKRDLLANQRGKPGRDLIATFLRTEFSIDDRGADDVRSALHVGPVVGCPPP